MKFVKTEDLKIGMRLAKPIYNKKGVLLYDRDSKLTKQGIDSVYNFGLLGIYILEPAEPLPPMSEEDMEFEKFQTVEVFNLIDELQYMVQNGKTSKLFQCVSNINRAFGHLDHKINFIQTLRSNTDFVYKHSLNVAIIASMMAYKMNIKPVEQEQLVTAALVHAIGLLSDDEKNNPTIVIEDEEESDRLEAKRLNRLDSSFLAEPNIKRICSQALTEMEKFKKGEETGKGKIFNTARILIVANEYDRMTAVNSQGETPYTEISALKYFMENADFFGQDVINALTGSINFLADGCCVELSNGERALVLSSNDKNVLRPMVLCFSTNTILDLSLTAIYGDIEVADIMKTLDNRHVIDDNMLSQFKG